MSYILPQLQVFQEFNTLPAAVVQNLNAFVFGPQYQLFRYAEAAEKALVGLGAYSPAADVDYAYPDRPVNSIVDEAYVKLFGDDVVLKYLTVPAAAANPLVVVGAAEPNKLRSAPRIAAMVKPAPQTTVTAVSGGYFTGKVALPESYYFYPSADFTLNTAPGQMSYVTNSGLSGSFNVPAGAVAGATVLQAADGATMRFTAGTGVTAQAPKTVKFKNAAGTSYFTVAPALAAMIDAQIYDGALFTVTAIEAGSVVIAYASHGLSVQYKNDDTTLATVRADIVGALAGASVDQLFDISPITGSGLDTTDDTLVGGVSIVGSGAQKFMGTTFKTSVYPNAYVFVTANGVSRDAALLKNVEIGDKVHYRATVGATVHEGDSTVAGFEADMTLPVVGEVVANAANQIDQAATNLCSGAALVAAAGTNARMFPGGATKVYSLDTSGNYPDAFTSLLAGVKSDTYAVQITASGAKGSARATVTNASGTYRRTGVLVENHGINDGQLYIGNNMYINFDKGAEDGVFQAGDSYSVTVSFEVAAIDNAVDAGVFGGPQNTIYTIEVVNGGFFNPAALALPGVSNTTINSILPDASGWTGGNVDDEYVLTCMATGNAHSAMFKLTSNRGDSATNVVFPGALSPITVGNSGLVLQLGTNDIVNAGEYFVVYVRAARPKIRITDSAGIDQESIVEVSDMGLINVGLYGVTMIFPPNGNYAGMDNLAGNSGGLFLGDRFSISAIASQPGAVHTLVLSDDLPLAVVPGLDINGLSAETPTLVSADLQLVELSAEIPEENHNPAVAPGLFNWMAAPDQVSVNSDIALQSSRWVNGSGVMPYLPITSAQLYLEYRALLTENSNSLYTITDTADVVNMLGTIDPDNPLAFGVNMALQNSGAQAVYFMALPTDDIAGWAAVLNKLTLTSNIYALAPVTTDGEVLAMVEAHVLAMSTELNKKWRIAYVGTEMPTQSSVLTRATNPLGVDWLATVTEDSRSPGSFTKVTLTTNGNLTTKLKAGDSVLLLFHTDDWGNVVYTMDTVAEIASNTVFYLVGGLDSAKPSQKLEAYHPMSVEEIAQAVAAQSSNFMNRRIYRVFPGNLGAFGTYVGAEMGACAVAGLCSSVAPQQGLTNIAMVGFDDLPVSYGMFNMSQLNEIAAGGTFILMQDVQGGDVYVRHQISTAYATGDINQSENSITKDLDSISYYFSSTLAPFIGKYNVTPELIDVIRAHIRNGINYLGSFTSVGLLGPMLIVDGTQIVTLQQHPTLKDRIVCTVNVQLPYPLNVIELHLVV